MGKSWWTQKRIPDEQGCDAGMEQPEAIEQPKTKITEGTLDKKWRSAIFLSFKSRRCYILKNIIPSMKNFHTELHHVAVNAEISRQH